MLSKLDYCNAIAYWPAGSKLPLHHCNVHITQRQDWYYNVSPHMTRPCDEYTMTIIRPLLQNFGGQKRQNFGNFGTWSRISPERNKISLKGKRRCKLRLARYSCTRTLYSMNFGLHMAKSAFFNSFCFFSIPLNPPMSRVFLHVLMSNGRWGG